MEQNIVVFRQIARKADLARQTVDRIIRAADARCREGVDHLLVRLRFHRMGPEVRNAVEAGVALSLASLRR